MSINKRYKDDNEHLQKLLKNEQAAFKKYRVDMTTLLGKQQEKYEKELTDNTAAYIDKIISRNIWQRIFNSNIKTVPVKPEFNVNALLPKE